MQWKSLSIKKGRIFMRCNIFAATLALSVLTNVVAASYPPGTVINYNPSESGIYIGGPGIAILPNGDYAASHSFFGPASKRNRMAVLNSKDAGKTWQKLTDLHGQWWSSLFAHNDHLYIIGVSKAWGDIVIRRSLDGGRTWTKPENDTSGLLLKGTYHCAPVPVVVHKGRIWRAFEEKGWDSFVMSAPADADLLDADNWTASNKIPVDKEVVGKKWLEGNVVVTPDGGLVNILRTQPGPGRAAVIEISPDGKKISFDGEKGIIDFPGAAKKFTIRFDKASGKYWSLVNIVTDPGPLELEANEHRNTLALVCSKDLRNWERRYIPLSFMKGAHLTDKNNKFGFQYIDWLIEGDDIIFVSRTAWGWDTPRSHDSNYITFHRISNFRSRTLEDASLNASSTFGADGLERVKYNNSGLTADLGVGLWAWPLPMDYDGDGDYDLVVSCSDKPYNGTYFFENKSGNVKMPVFELAVRIGSGLRNVECSYIDGKHRVLTAATEHLHFADSSKAFKETASIYPEKKIHNAKGRTRANQWKYCDFDGDGDLDLIVGVGDWTEYGWDNAYDSRGRWTRGPLHGYVYLILNTGSADAPAYAKPEMLQTTSGPVDVYGMPSPNLEDFDGDGDLDIICGEFVDGFTYFENIGSRRKPKYAKGRALTNSNGPLKMDLCMIVPVAIDWDKDGDIDLVVGQEDGRIALMDNTGKVIGGMPQFSQPQFFRQQAAEVKFGALVTPYSIDWDDDGDEDLICGNTAGYVGFVENLDGGYPPKWAEPKYIEADGKVIHIQAGPNGSIQGPCEAKWGYTTLNVADWNHDGLGDIIVNSIWGKVMWYRNVGTRKQPKLSTGRPIEVEWPGTPPKPAWTWWEPQGKQLATQWRTTPVVIDLNKDGLNDLVMLDHEGYLAFFERTKKDDNVRLSPGRRIFKNETGELLRLNKRNAGGSGRRKLCFVDWDGDGRLDLIVNHRNAQFYRNVSKEDGDYVFENMGMVDDRILAGHTTSPTIVDWDKNGVGDLLLGAEDGLFYYMQNPHAGNP